MAQAPRPSIPLKDKENVNPSINRITEATAEDFKEIASLFIWFADWVDGQVQPAKFYKFHSSLETLKVAHPNPEADGWAVIIPESGPQYIASVVNGVWEASEVQAPIQRYSNKFARPEVGNENVIYIVEDSNTLSFWYNNKYNDLTKGSSAYQVWLDEGNQGEPADFIAAITGPQGPQGEQGPVGPQGPEGIQGPQGLKGNTGDPGPKGDAGPVGPEGPQGPKGNDGTSVTIQATLNDTSELPATGNDGDGYLIPDSTTGLKHLWVWDGSTFVDNGQIQGPEGPQGPQGQTGVAGPQGEQGIPGAEGPAGPQGPQGPQGATGAKGDTGDTGPVGPQGPTGAQGVKGDTGDIGPVGPKGDAFIYEDFTPTQLENLTGPQGEQGIPGETGPVGPKGDTGAVGPQGPTGAQGEQGETGPAGPKGDTGAVGPQGPEGPAGSDANVTQTNIEAALSYEIQKKLTTDGSLYLDNETNQIGANLSTYQEEFTWNTGDDKTFNTAVDLTYITGVYIGGRRLTDKEYAFTSPNQVTTGSLVNDYTDGVIVAITGERFNSQGITPYYSKLEADTKNQQTFNEIKQVTEAISAGEGGKLYDTLAAAQSVDPKPVDGTVFTVSGKGYYTFQSTESNGTRYERFFYEVEDVTGEKIQGKYVNSSGSILNLSTSDITDFIEVEENQTIFFSGSTALDQPSVAGYDENKNFVSEILEGGDYNSEKVIIPSGISFIVGNARNETRVPTPSVLLKIETKNTVTREDIRSLDLRVNEVESVSNNFEPSKNLINPETIIRGYWDDNGLLKSSANTIRTGLISVLPETNYTISGIGAIGLNKRILCFNESGTLIGSLDKITANSEPRTYTTPAGASSVGINIASITGITDEEINNFKSYIMLEEGSQATVYEKFGTKLKQNALPKDLNKNPDIKLLGISSTEFHVHSLTERGDYLVHKFEKIIRPDYADDGWIASDISHKGNLIIQGNFNWIHIVNKTNENQHVGLLHGCETFIDSHFFIDGREFNPADIVGDTIEGKEFSFNWISTMYAADSANTTAGHLVVPQEPLIESTRHYVAGKIKGHSEIEWRNKLMILRDDTSFSKCYIAMLGGYYPYLNRVQYENVENTLNSMDSENGVSVVAPSTALINDYSFDTADGKRAELAHVAKMWSTENNYKVVQEVYNLDNSQQRKMHIQATGAGTNFRKKLYWHPIITTTVASRAGVPADVFNEGDVIEGVIKRKITV